MLKDFFKRIIAEAIRELISPQLNDIRAAIEKVDARLHDEITELRAAMEKGDAELRAAMERGNAALRDEMQSFNSELKEDIRSINRRLDDLFKIVVRRDEHFSLEEDVKKLRADVELLKRKVSV